MVTQAIETVTIVGVGLIGGSVGMALRGRGLARRVIGLGRNTGRLEEAARLGAIDTGTTEPAEALAQTDVAVICTPVTRIASDVRMAAELGPASILVTDAGSTKRRIVEEVERIARARAAFVAAHPIAGSERSGVAHARADLFEGRACVVVSTERTPRDRLERARAFWTSLGCVRIEMGPAEHDAALAYTSHLPHAVAAALAAAVPTPLLNLAAGAFRDGTRVAAADAELWTGIFLANRMPLIEALGAFQDEVATLKMALINGDEAAIRAWWEKARSHLGTLP